jgi:hypothetical protein
MSLEEAIIQARETNSQRRAAGFDQQALDESARQGFANGAFEESWEDAPAVVEEFYPDPAGDSSEADNGGGNTASRGLADKLRAKTAELAS